MVLYPNYLAFFTLNLDSPGTKLLFKEFLKNWAESLSAQVKLNEWVQDPTEFGQFTGKWQDKFQATLKAIAEANSRK